MTESVKQKAEVEKKENLLLNFLLNIILPTIVLIKFSGDDWLGARNGIIVALSFPIAYGLYDFARIRKVNVFSCIGIVSVLLTGGISLLKLDPKYIAIKEAAIPAIIGIVALVSIYTKYPLLKTVLFNKKLVQVDKVEKALGEGVKKAAFDSSFRIASFIFASSFFLSAVLNYALAKYLVVSPPGTEQFNAELGKMTALSYPIIMIPSMIISIGSIIFLFRRISAITNLSFDQIMVDPEAPGK